MQLLSKAWCHVANSYRSAQLPLWPAVRMSSSYAQILGSKFTDKGPGCHMLIIFVANHVYLSAAVDCGRITAFPLQCCAECARPQSEPTLAQRGLWMYTCTLQGALSCHNTVSTTHVHVHTCTDRWMLVVGFVMSVLSMESKHTLTLQSFYYHGNIQCYRHSTHTQVPGLRCWDHFCHFNKWCHHKGKWSYHYSLLTSGGTVERQLGYTATTAICLFKGEVRHNRIHFFVRFN